MFKKFNFVIVHLVAILTLMKHFVDFVMSYVVTKILLSHTVELIDIGLCG